MLFHIFHMHNIIFMQIRKINKTEIVHVSFVFPPKMETHCSYRSYKIQRRSNQIQMCSNLYPSATNRCVMKRMRTQKCPDRCPNGRNSWKKTCRPNGYLSICLHRTETLPKDHQSKTEAIQRHNLHIRCSSGI